MEEDIVHKVIWIGLILQLQWYSSEMNENVM